jgi:hypothetical protein
MEIFIHQLTTATDPPSLNDPNITSILSQLFSSNQFLVAITLDTPEGTVCVRREQWMAGVTEQVYPYTRNYFVTIGSINITVSHSDDSSVMAFSTVQKLLKLPNIQFVGYGIHQKCTTSTSLIDFQTNLFGNY